MFGILFPSRIPWKLFWQFSVLCSGPRWNRCILKGPSSSARTDIHSEVFRDAVVLILFVGRCRWAVWIWTNSERICTSTQPVANGQEQQAPNALCLALLLPWVWNRFLLLSCPQVQVPPWIPKLYLNRSHTYGGQSFGKAHEVSREFCPSMPDSRALQGTHAISSSPRIVDFSGQIERSS